MTEPSRESFNASKKYKRVTFLEGRYVPDFSLNELQEIQDEERRGLGDTLYNQSAIVGGLEVELPGSGQMIVKDGKVWVYGRVEDVTGLTLGYDPAKVTGEDVVFLRWLADRITLAEDASLVHVPLGEAIDERLRTQAQLVTSSPDLFDETFETFQGTVPLNWELISGVSAVGYPGKFGQKALELRHTIGTETRIEREITLPLTTAFNLYFWTRTQEGYVDLSLSHGAYVDFERTSPAWLPADVGFTATQNWTRHTGTFTSDGNAQSVKIRIVIPSTAPTTRILIDALLVTTSALTASQLERHYVPVFVWDRATDAVSRAVERSSRLPMKELVPPLPGRDIDGIDQNLGLKTYLARRTYHENGHFRLPPGLRVGRDVSRDTGSQLGIVVRPGWGYVAGFDCRVAETQELLVNKALTFVGVTGENDAFAFGTNLYGLNKAEGTDLFPVKEITQLQVTYERVVSITKGADGSVDDTGVENVSSIQGVCAGTAGSIAGTATTFTFTETANEFIAAVSPYAGGAVGANQSIKFSTGTYTIAQILEALNDGSGVAYRSGKIVGNVIFDNDGSGHVRIKTKTLSSTSTVTLGSGSANTILGFTNSATNTGTGTQYVETTAWVRSGNSVDWVPGQTQPSPGASYSVVVRNTETLVLNTDYRLGGAFVAEVVYRYKITAIVGGTEGQASATAAVITTPVGGINRVAWPAVASTQSYGVYRSDDGGSTYRLLKFVDGTLLSFLDDGSITPNASINPPGSGAAGPTPATATASSVGVINLNPVGKMPVDGSNLVVNYDYYQPYMAFVVMNVDAVIFTIEGDPADQPSPPSIPPDVMELAQLEVKANSTTIVIQDVKKYDRVPQADMRTLMDRVNKMEVNDLRLFILDDLQKRGDGSTHKGRVAEGFDDEAGVDFAYNSGGVTANMGLHSALKMVSLPSTYTQPTLVVNTGNTTAIKQEEDYILPSSEETLVSQSLRSEYLPINPYLGVRIPARTIEMFPRATSWAFKMNSAVTPQQKTSRINVLFAALWRKTVGRFLPPWNNDAEIIQQASQHALRKGLGTTFQFETEPVAVTVEGRGFIVTDEVGHTNIRGFFGGVAVDLTAVSPTTQGTAFNGKTTVNADTMGRWKATFVIPTGISAGADDLLVTNPAGASARATYTSLVVGDVVPEPPLQEVPLYDPLAQSIGPFPVDKTLSAVELWFIYFGPTRGPDRPIYLQIRTMENGSPTRISLATKVINPNDVNWNTLNNWTGTKITLDRYVHIPKGTQVAITLLTASPIYRVAAATRGQKAQTGKIVYSNPYGPGVLFASSNGVTWESFQNSDLAMVVYGRTFNASAVLEFNSVSPSAVSRLWLAADQVVPEASTVKWEYVLNGGQTLPISPFTKVRPPVIPTSIVLRARLSRAASGVTPRINLNTLALVGVQRTASATLITPAVTFTQTMTNALMTASAHIPSGATVTWYVSRDDGAVWTAMGAPTDIIDLNAYWKEYQWNTPVALGGSSTTKKLRVRAELVASSHLNYGPIIGKLGVALT